MLKFDPDESLIQECPKGSTHVLKGSFANLEFDTQAATDLFCYNQNSLTGAFFATVKNNPGDGRPYKVGENHIFVSPWTHIIYVPVFSIAYPLPNIYKLLLFYDAASGVAEVYETDGRGNLILKKRHTSWRAFWTYIVGGQFGKANLLFYDAANTVGEFYFMNNSGDIQLIEGWS
jgi:hypothetical protein